MQHSLLATYQDLSNRGVSVSDFKFNSFRCISLQEENAIGIDQSKFGTEAERNTALIHEDGHFISGAFYLPFSEYQIKEKAECRADKAAILRFIPYHELFDQLQSERQLYEIADHFNVTEQYILKAYLMYKDNGYSFSNDPPQMDN